VCVRCACILSATLRLFLGSRFVLCFLSAALGGKQSYRFIERKGFRLPAFWEGRIYLTEFGVGPYLPE